MRVQLDGRVHALEVEGGGLGEDVPHLQVWWHRGLKSVHHRIPEAAADMTQRQRRAREDVLRATIKTALPETRDCKDVSGELRAVLPASHH